MGQEYAQQIVKSMGVYQDQKVQDYVSGLGMALAAKSERPNCPGPSRDGRPDGERLRAPGRVHLRDPRHPDPHEQRGGAGRRPRPRDRACDRPALGPADDARAVRADRTGVGSIISSDIAKYARAWRARGWACCSSSTGGTRRASRTSSASSTWCGTGTTRGRMATMFETLERVSKLEGAGDIPEWASTHPNPGNRVQATQDGWTPFRPAVAARTSRETYLPVLAGMTYGEDPQQGYFDGNTFYHPGLRFKLELPAGGRRRISRGTRRGESQQDAHAAAHRAG